MDPNWIIALCALGTLLLAVGGSLYKFVSKVRSDKASQDKAMREAAQKQAEEALRIAREETKAERQKYEDALLKQIADLQQDVNNEEQAREALQSRYEALLKQTGSGNG